MAERPDDEYEMKHRGSEEPQDNNYNHWETQFNDPDDMEQLRTNDVDTIEPLDTVGPVEVIIESRESEDLREIFNEIFGSPIRVDDNRELFESCIIRSERSANGIHTRLFYKNEAIYYKRGVKGKWRSYAKFKINNPMYPEFEKAKRSYDESATKQVNDEAGVLVTEVTSEEVIQEVIDELSEQSDDFEVTPSFQGGLKIAQPQPQVIDVSDLETKVSSLEDANKKLWKSLRMSEYKLNKLRVEGASGDVINAQQQEINDIQTKLKKTKLERDQLLLDVVVTNELLTEATNKVAELTERNKSINEEYKEFRDAATKRMKAERQEVADRYREQAKYDKEQAREEYTKSMAEIKSEYIRELRLKKDENTKARNELDSAKERIKFLEDAVVKQHKKAGSKEPEQSSDNVERVSRGVQQTIDKIFNAIDDNEYDEQYINDNMEHLKVQAKDFEQKAKKSRGLLKKLNENAQKYIERRIDEINLRLDRKVEYPEAKQRLKEAANNNPKVKFEKLKKWMKDNGLEVSTLVISIGGLIAALAAAFRNTVQTIAKGTFSFGKAVVKVLSKLGPVFSALGNILMSVLGLVSKALMWLGNNLWMLLLLFVMFLWKFSEKMYNKYKRSK